MTKINFQTIKINNLRNSSGLFLGTNNQKGRVSKNILNEGFGTVNGKNSEVKKNSANIEKK
ncbi:hypothetical protein [Heyndrickxia acidicola]|uniref:Uncharacterized protein n=1 Tax=Heyndrickxia acidicola TaxID=209389 RepID=A0ABU6MHS3_9BACI|nr:hypothetical protein [Heyndrickxia acidicola]MED1203947.1 hypothetical protein [Heyndrickxia acidicola]